jgi:hypothetical protein
MQGFSLFRVNGKNFIWDWFSYFSNNLKSVLFSLSKQIGIFLKSTALFLVKSVADKNTFTIVIIQRIQSNTARRVDNQTILKVIDQKRWQ